MRLYVREWREKKRLTQAALARMTGRSLRTIRRWERRETGLRMSSEVALAQALGIPPDRLAERP